MNNGYMRRIASRLWETESPLQRLVNSVLALCFAGAAGWLVAVDLWWVVVSNIAVLAAYFFTTLKVLERGAIKDGVVVSASIFLPVVLVGLYVSVFLPWEEFLTHQTIWVAVHGFAGFLLGLKLCRPRA